MKQSNEVRRSIIISHYKNPYHAQTPEPQANLYNTHHFFKQSGCIDQIIPSIIFNRGVIEGAYYNIVGCVVATAVASVISQTIENKNLINARAIIANYFYMIHGEPFSKKIIGDLIIFENVKSQPERIGCAVLPADAFLELISNIKKEQVDMSKKEIRTKVLNDRTNIPKNIREAANDIITTKVINMIDHYRFKHIALYCSLSDEVSTTAIIKKLLNRKVNVYLPRVCDNYTMTFHKIYDLERDAEISKKTRVREPLAILPIVDIAKIDCFIVPVVAFDKDNNRLGYGKGYYDRLLSRFTKRKVGLAYATQKISSIPTEPHDVPLDNVITN